MACLSCRSLLLWIRYGLARRAKHKNIFGGMARKRISRLEGREGKGKIGRGRLGVGHGWHEMAWHGIWDLDIRVCFVVCYWELGKIKAKKRKRFKHQTIDMILLCVCFVCMFKCIFKCMYVMV
ncbi:hypothetical protein BKA61DRAFT_356128 [Leptodontidium sp. MPI-SDFR-AT-0119]|nr:hypothetical protein BKA61DRAFT_356128 [Leptodontidium sp. MPI-SDFR-AT-0119]